MDKAREFLCRFAIAALLLISGMLFSCKPPHALEKEPNDGPASAREISSGESVSGYLQTDKDRDFYLLTRGSSPTVRVAVSGVKGINIAIHVYTRGSRLIKIVDDNRKSSGEEIANLHVPSDGLYLSVQHGDRDERTGNQENLYVLTVTGNHQETGELEPNDTIDHALTIHDGETVQGFFSPAQNRLNRSKDHPLREEDWYVFETSFNETDMKILEVRLSPVPGIKNRIELYDRKGTLLAGADGASAGSDGVLAGFGLKGSRRYYLAISAPGIESNHETRYTLVLKFRDHSESDETEKNDTFEKANPMKGDTMNGAVSSPDDVDFFQLGERRGIYSVSVTPEEKTDIVAEILDAERKRILVLNSGRDGDPEYAPNLTLAKGSFLKISAKSREGQGGYAVAVLPVNDTENLEREPNNSPAQANLFKGEVVEGYQSGSGDTDVFHIITGKRTNLQFTLKGIDGVTTRVAVTDPNGFEIKSIEVKGAKTADFSEMIDRSGYCIVTFTGNNFRDRYRLTRTVEK